MPEGFEFVEDGVDGVVVEALGFAVVFEDFAGGAGEAGAGVAVAGGTGAGVVPVVAGGGWAALATASGTAGFFDSARPGSLTLRAPPAVNPYAADAASSTANAASEAVGSARRSRRRSRGSAAWPHSTQIS